MTEHRGRSRRDPFDIDTTMGRQTDRSRRPLPFDDDMMMGGHGPRRSGMGDALGGGRRQRFGMTDDAVRGGSTMHERRPGGMRPQRRTFDNAPGHRHDNCGLYGNGICPNILDRHLKTGVANDDSVGCHPM